MVMRDGRDGLTLPTKYGDFEIGKNDYDPILGRKIGRVRLPDGGRVEGFYDRPLVCWSSRNEQYSLFRDAYSLLRSIRYAQDWEGGGQDELLNSDHQKLLAWLHQHHNLLSWATRMTPREEERFREICETLARDMGRPIDDIKEQIQTLTLKAALAEGEDQEASELLKQAIGLDEDRIDTIEAIAARLDVRAAVVLREIVTQQDIMKACYAALPNAIQRHHMLMDTHAGRGEHFDRIKELAIGLGQIKDRPWHGLARHTKKDLHLYLEQTTSGDYRSAVRHLERAEASALCARAIRQVNMALAYLGLARGRNGHRGQELRAKATGVIMHLSTFHQLEDGPLSNNPLPGIVGRAKDALMILRSERPDLGDVSSLLDEMNKMLG